MMHHLRRRAFLGSLFAATTVATTAWAHEVPFKITGAGEGPLGLPLPGQPAREHWAIGEATHLGRYYGLGSLVTYSANPPDAHGIITGTFGSGSPFVFTAANGDELVVEYGLTAGADELGTFKLTIVDVLNGGRTLIVEGHFMAEFVVQADMSTGRFAGVSGSWRMDAYTEPFILGSSDPVAYQWEGEGTLDFPTHGR